MANVDKDNACSVSSYITMATTDDNRGAGWTLDRYLYQLVERKIDRIALQSAIPLLSPYRNFQYIEEHHFKGVLSFHN